MIIKYLCRKSGWQAIYGSMSCNLGSVWHWKILINKIPQNRIFIGISSNHSNAIFSPGVYGYYASNNGGNQCVNGKLGRRLSSSKCKDIHLNSGDVVEMILDLDTIK